MQWNQAESHTPSIPGILFHVSSGKGFTSAPRAPGNSSINVATTLAATHDSNEPHLSLHACLVRCRMRCVLPGAFALTNHILLVLQTPNPSPFPPFPFFLDPPLPQSCPYHSCRQFLLVLWSSSPFFPKNACQIVCTCVTKFVIWTQNWTPKLDAGRKTGPKIKNGPKMDPQMDTTNNRTKGLHV